MWLLLIFISGQRQSLKTHPGELGVSKSMGCDIFPFSALTLLVGRQEGHPACKKLDVGLLVVMLLLEVCLRPCHPYHTSSWRKKHLRIAGTNFFTGRKPFLSPSQHRQITEQCNEMYYVDVYCVSNFTAVCYLPVLPNNIVLNCKQLPNWITMVR